MKGFITPSVPFAERWIIEMKLLLLGARSHGVVCGEIAVACVYEVAFLDDNAPEEIGKLESYKEKRLKTPS